MASKMLPPTPTFLGLVVGVVLLAASCHAEVHSFSTFASCTDPGTPFVADYKLLSFSADLLMDAHKDTFTDHYNYVAAGTSRGVDP